MEKAGLGELEMDNIFQEGIEGIEGIEISQVSQVPQNHPVPEEVVVSDAELEIIQHGEVRPLSTLPSRPAILTSQKVITLVEQRQQICSILYSAKLEDPEQIRTDAKDMDWDTFSKVTSRLDKTSEVKIDHQITAMGILGLIGTRNDRE